MIGRPDPRLLVSIHDVGPKFGDAIRALVDRLSTRLDGRRFAMLVVPDHWGEAPIARDPAFAARLREWADAGVEMFLHGWQHRDDTAHDSSLARFKARRLTASEGEFLGLGYDEALRRLHAGRDVVEQATGRSVTGFVAPAWLYGPDSRRAIAAAGFRMAEDHLRVWDPGNGRVLARGPVVTWASRSEPRIQSSLLAAAALRNLLALMPTIRVAVHPGDTGDARLLASIDRTIERFLRTHPAARYASLVRPG